MGTGVELLVTVVVGLAIAVGIAGTVLPLLPGIALVWVAMLAYGLLLGFGWQGWVAMALATSLAGLGLALGVLIPGRSAAASGVSSHGQLLGLVGAVAGFFLVPVIGAPLGFVAGIWLHRWRASRDPGAAWRSTRATVAAIFKASAAQMVCAFGMAITWGLWVAVG